VKNYTKINNTTSIKQVTVFQKNYVKLKKQTVVH